MTLKTWLGVVQGRLKWRRSIDRIRFFYWSAIVNIALSCIMREIKRYIGWKSQFFHTPAFDALPVRISP